MIIFLNAQLAFENQVTHADSIYVITEEMDLGNSSLNHNNIITIPANCTLKFLGGSLKNGVIQGQNTTINNPSNCIIFNNIELETAVETDAADNTAGDSDPIIFLPPVTGWLGECRDIWFNYDESSKEHFVLVKSVCQFEVCSFSRRDYFINQWQTIYLRPYGCIINGGGANFFITSNKGATDQWGENNQYLRYRTPCLFLKHMPNRYGQAFVSGEKAGSFIVSDLTILDNQKAPSIQVLGPLESNNWGEPPFSASHPFTLYTLFQGSGNQTLFRNISYDGYGGLWAHYNYEAAIERFDIVDCDIKTAQFAFELGNVCRNDLSHRYPNGGSCQRFCIRQSRIYNYATNVLVGPLSIDNQDDNKESSITRKVVIEDSVFESEKVKNLELKGARSVYIRNNTFLSVFCSSQHQTYFDNNAVERPINKEFYVVGNVFRPSDTYLSENENALVIDAGDIFFINNVVTADFGEQNKPKGGFYLRGYGNNTATVSGNVFIIKHTNNEYFKSLLFYENTMLDLIGNSYCFTEGVKQGYEVSIGGRGGFLHLEVEDDPRFQNVAGGGFTDWKAIPLQQRTPEGYLQKGGVLMLPNCAENYTETPLTSFEIDFKVHLDGLGKEGTSTLASFSTRRILIAGDQYLIDVLIQTHDGAFRVGVASGNPVQFKYYSSHLNLQLALPFLGLDSCGDNVGVIRVVFVNETIDFQNNAETPVTRVVLSVNDYQIDTFLLAHLDDATPDVQDILSHGIKDISLTGSNFVCIKNYRLRTQVKTTPNPAIAVRLTQNPNSGFSRYGASSGRPVSPRIGFQYFDTQLGKPIFYTGTVWVDASGTQV